MSVCECADAVERDWELERGLASSAAFDDERRNIADRILRARYAGFEVGVTLWILTIAFGAGVIALIVCPTYRATQDSGLPLLAYQQLPHVEIRSQELRRNQRLLSSRQV